MISKMKGVYTALVTPFNSEGEIDAVMLRDLIRFQIAHGVDGIVVLGTTGEAPTLTEEEQRLVLSISVEEAHGKISLWAGTGHNSTQLTIEQTQLAKNMGVDGVLIVTPYYNKPTQEGMYRHYSAIAEAVEIPILIYNVPGRTGQNLQEKTLKKLSENPHIIGVKETSGNLLQIMDIIHKILPDRPDFKVMSGDDELTLPIIAIGGHGVISAVSNLVPGKIKELVSAALRGDFVSARQWHYHLYPLFKAAFLETNPAPIKAMMNECGMSVGECRLPLSPVLPENKSFIINALALCELENLMMSP